MSPNQACSIDTAYWGAFAFHTACPMEEISATYTYGVYETTDQKKCVTRGEDLPVEGNIDSLEKCAL